MEQPRNSKPNRDRWDMDKVRFHLEKPPAPNREILGIDEILKDVHWDVLLFFISLFIIVGGLEASGVLAILGRSITALTEQGLYLAVIAVLWIGAIASGVVSNVPFTIAMLPILKGLAAQGVAVTPLWWALAIPAIVLPVGFLADFSAWLWWDSYMYRLFTVRFFHWPRIRPQRWRRMPAINQGWS